MPQTPEQQRVNRKKNKERYREHDRKKYQKQKERDPHFKRKQSYKYRYGITIEQYDEMFQIQQGKCKICKVETELVLDHCHTTGYIRGLLCRCCNLGYFKDSPYLLDYAYQYAVDNVKKTEF